MRTAIATAPVVSLIPATPLVIPFLHFFFFCRGVQAKREHECCGDFFVFEEKQRDLT